MYKSTGKLFYLKNNYSYLYAAIIKINSTSFKSKIIERKIET